MRGSGDRHAAKLAAEMAPQITVDGPVITFLSDYGLDDNFVGVCHGVITMICPGARVIDITHGVAPHDVRAGALLLRGALAYMPVGVHLAVVDPGVGTERRAVALRSADGRMLVGPDNGLLSPAAEDCGGVLEAVDIGRSQYRLEPVSATFHGRDIFSPVAARLASGARLGDVGDRVEPDTLVALVLPSPRLEDGALVAHAVDIDRFGNVALDVALDDLVGVGVKLGCEVSLSSASDSVVGRHVCTFAQVDAGDLLLYENGDRTLAVAVNRGSAASRLGLAPCDELRIRPT